MGGIKRLQFASGRTASPVVWSASNSCRVQLIFLLAVPGGETSRYLGSVLNSGARLYEPQHIAMQSKPLRVADPRSENKLRHCCYLQLLASLAKLGQNPETVAQLLAAPDAEAMMAVLKEVPL